MPKARAMTARKPNLNSKLNSKSKANRRPKSSPKSKSKSTTTKSLKLRVKRPSGAGGALQLFSIFGGREKAKQNFSTRFQYGNLAVDVNSRVKGNMVTFNIKVNSKNFNFNGVATLNALAFATLHDMFDHIRSNLSR